LGRNHWGSWSVLGVKKMTVKARLNRRHARDRFRRDGRRLHAVMRRETPGQAAHAEVAPIREGGPPQDHAVYTCECGCVFEATVSTSVDCPYCGTAQAW
jgi:rubrerythrin